MPGDSNVAEAADSGRGERLGVDAAPVAFEVPQMAEFLDDVLGAGETCGADLHGRVADQQLRPDHLGVWAEVEDAD
jgi:hypothetical protein